MSLDPVPEEDTEDEQPLTAAEFKDVVERVDRLGLTWTADMPPLLRPKESGFREALNSTELKDIQRRYPQFPAELGLVMLHLMTGAELPPDLIGNSEDLAIKAGIIAERVISPELKHDYFFNHSLKLPCFVNADWEVSLKVLERDVQSLPIIAYAAISIDFKNPSYDDDETSKRLTFAVDEKMIERLIRMLREAQESLEKAREMKHTLEDHYLKPGADGNV
jgi:hypothetical protein